jgi:hypothetical protein
LTSVISESEIKLLTDARLRKDRQARRASNRARFARRCFEAYEQGGVLTQLDLSLLSGLSANYTAKPCASTKPRLTSSQREVPFTTLAPQ